MGVSAVKVSGVDVVRGGRHLLFDITFTAQPGEHWVLLGPNGAGKSTLLSLLGARVHPTRGSVEVLGRRLGRVDMRELRTLIGHVDPRHKLDQPMSALEVVLTGLTNTAVRVTRDEPSAAHTVHARALLTALGMGERLHTVWTTMSQGECGRVLIARALISRPRLLLLDEPSTGLDLAAREQLMDALGHLATADPELTTVMVTHHLEEIPSHTTHVLMLGAGVELASGAVSEVLNSKNVTDCFGYPMAVTRASGRWIAHSERQVRAWHPS
ncbi:MULTISPECIES: ATP-binding cassette domain-containing protein [unclassified Rhodococcus (in: high G+C Gram-positive bacteria)]|uniref:ABC transporter ATP-binding protein n=1 Tax=unclassified Rhodococcus (in: high G+C Gram-positive bacteria) TaxID=192944 RepID=UPI001FFB54E5|nr:MULTISPECIES: ATP-binding cassette domain-containing protein [unclassified Rhodococcus (in: high G+C Gram-positive bacteria)]